MKRFAVSFLCLGLLCAVPVMAQTESPSTSSAQSDAPPPPPDGGPHHGGPEHRLEMLQHALNLSTEQTAQVKALLAEEHAKGEAIRSNTSLSAADRHTQMAALHQDTTTKMHALLSTEQAAKYDAMEQHMRDHRRGEGPGGGAGEPPQGPGER